MLNEWPTDLGSLRSVTTRPDSVVDFQPDVIRRASKTTSRGNTRTTQYHYSTAKRKVNTIHHQAVVDAGPWHVVGWATDGTIEALEQQK